MDKYTREDIIIFSDDERLKDAIGKECYFSDSPNSIIIEINRNKIKPCKLNRIESNKFFTFIDANSHGWHCLVIKKEEPKEYIPFDNIKELVEASLEHNKNHYLSKVGGLWLKHKKDGLICLITSTINDNKVYYLFFENEPYGLDDIFDDFCFLDGTPCGKKKE